METKREEQPTTSLEKVRQNVGVSRLSAHRVLLSKAQCREVISAIGLNKIPLTVGVSYASAEKLVAIVFNLGLISSFGSFLPAKDLERLKNHFEKVRVDAVTPNDIQRFKDLQKKLNGWRHLRFRLPIDPNLQQISRFIASEDKAQLANTRNGRRGRWVDSWRIDQNARVLSAYYLVTGRKPAPTEGGPTVRFLSKFYEVSRDLIDHVVIDPTEDEKLLRSRWLWKDPERNDRSWVKEIEAVVTSNRDYTIELAIDANIPPPPPWQNNPSGRALSIKEGQKTTLQLAIEFRSPKGK